MRHFVSLSYIFYTSEKSAMGKTQKQSAIKSLHSHVEGDAILANPGHFFNYSS